MTVKKETTFFADYQALINDVARLKKSASNPFFKSGYVPLKDVLEEAKRICKANNFILMQAPDVLETPTGVVPVLRTKLVHVSGETSEGKITLPCQEENNPQKLGGALTYMRRYSLTTMLGIEEADDDGNHSTGNTKTIAVDEDLPF